MKTKFYYCLTCGNVVVKAVDSGVVPFCCGKQMIELVPGSVDATKEKHVPVFRRVDDKKVIVEVGESPHPMTKEHHIVFIYLETEDGGQIKYLDPEKPAKAEFCECGGKITAVYAYCNIHGLWKTEVNEQCKSCCAYVK